MLIFEVLLFVTVSWSIVEDDGIKSCKSWHPILMTFGFAFCMNEGLLAFYFGDICDKARNDSRKKHGILQVLSIFSILAGYIVMFIHHFGSKKKNGTNANANARAHHCVENDKFKKLAKILRDSSWEGTN